MKRITYVILSILLIINLLGCIFFIGNHEWVYQGGWDGFFTYLSRAGFSVVLIYIIFLLSELQYNNE